MSWKIRFKLLEGWLLDQPSFRTRREATAYAIAVASQHMGIVDFDAVKRCGPANSSFLAY
jgi:hypothetical protein